MTKQFVRRTKRLEERRVQSVRRVLAGESPTAVAREIGVVRTTVADWVTDYKKGGWEALKAKPKPGRPRWLSAEQHHELDQILMRGALAQGFDTDLWDCKRVAEVIRRRFDVSYHVDHIPRVLRRLGYSPQKPEHRAYERDEERIAQWVKRDWPRIKKIA